MLRRLRLKNTTLEELLEEAQHLQEEARSFPAGSKRELLIRRTRRAKAASHLREWLTSPGLRSPT
jgi:hypothetical protein